MWECFGLQAGKDGKPTDTGQAVHIKFVNGLSLLKREIAKFVVCIGKKKNVKKYMYTEVFSSIAVSRNPDNEVSVFPIYTFQPYLKSS